MTLESKGLRLIAEHNNHVQQNMADTIANIAKRMASHDQSKYSEEEFDLVEGKPYLQTLEYNTPEYKAGLVRVQTAVEHHYKANSHHPEHFYNGIKGMTLLDLIEMACDWQAASIEHDSDFLTSINRNVERFELSIEMQEILMNTGRELGWIK